MLGAMRTSWPREFTMQAWAQEKHHDIAVSAATQYLPEQSDEASGRYVFAYTITLRNAGSVAAAQLISRHWNQSPMRKAWCRKCAAWAWSAAQPLLEPGESFEYTSGASIATPVGTMRGSYQMVAAERHALRSADPGIHVVSDARASLILVVTPPFSRPGPPDDERRERQAGSSRE